MTLESSVTELEARQYNEDASPAEIASIKAQVSMYKEDIILYTEVVVISPFTVSVMFAEVEKRKIPNEKCGLLIDLTYCKIPDAKTRIVINQKFKELNGYIKHVGVVTGSNVIIKTALKFVLFQSNLNSYSISSTFEESVTAINKVLHG